jgi:hypothetical protein
MKIIGLAGNNVIAELKEDDVAALIGETYFGGSAAQAKLKELGLTDRGGYGGSDRLKVGATLDLAGRFSRVKQIESRHAELQDVATKLEAMAALLKHLGNQVIVPPAEEKAP